MDPRPAVIAKRLAGVRRIIIVSGGKGGIGKSSVASILALNLSARGHRTGLLDLDLNGPSAHIILGVPVGTPREDEGLIPPEFHGLRFMSVIYFTGDKPTAFRGKDISNAITELLAITLWDDLNFLIVDMPPGLGDTTLDVIRLIKRMEYVIVSTASRVAIEVAKKEITVLRQFFVPVIGVIENMSTSKDFKSPLHHEFKRLSVPYLGAIPYDATLEGALGDAGLLLATGFSRHVAHIVPAIEAFSGYPSL